MNRFTIFTIILSVSVITIFADLLVRDVVGPQGMASVISSQKDSQAEVSPVFSDSDESVAGDTFKDLVPDDAVTLEDPTQDENAPQSDSTSTPDSTASTQTTATPPVSFVTSALVKNAGFKGTIDKKQFPGKLYQLLDISTFPVESIDNYMIQEDTVAAASITEIVLRDEIQALQLYLLLQNKTKPYIDLTLNETNAYGDRSFYVNHKDKPNEAFLTVKIKNRIYGFAYVKFYHPELKKLIELLMEAK